MSNLLEQASLVMIPSGYKEDVVYSQIPLDGSGDMTLTRASNGTRINSAGLVEDCPWNLCINSEQFDTASWFKSSTTITANSGVAPNGTTTADKIVPTTTGINRWTEQSRAITIDNFYTNSAYIKADGFSWVALHHIDGSIGAWFNVSNGTVGTVNAGCTASIESVGNGWYRCSVAKNSGGTTGYTVVQLADADNSGTATASGTNGLLIWGAQTNIGSTAKPYFPTTDRLNVPRLTYQNGGGGCPSLLLEKQSTNILLNSGELDSWLKIDTSVTSNSTISPDGTQNADTVTATGSGSLSHLIYQNLAFTSGTAYTYSVFAKANTSNFIQMVFAGDFVANSYANFNLSNGTITASANLTPKIESMGNGWYRCSISATAGVSNTNSQIIYLINSGTASRGQAFTANGESVYLWGGQFEASSYVTTLIPTTSASATRVEDACSKTGISSLIGQTSGTLFVQWINLNNDLCNLIETYNSTTGITGTSSILIQKSANNEFNIRVFDSLGNYSDNFTATIPLGTNKIALAYEPGSAILYLNGLSIGSNSRTYVFVSTRDTISFDNRGGYARSEVVLFKTRLTNAQLASLTTI